MMAARKGSQGGCAAAATAEPVGADSSAYSRVTLQLPQDAATSFAKAMVKGIKMKVEEDPDAEPEPEEDEDEGEEEEDDGAYEDEDEGMAASADAIQANARIAHPLPASRQRRRTSLFADSGKHVQPPVTEET